MDWSSRDIELFLSVCRTLNFTVSARALGLTQSAVSRSIAEFERRLGFVLLVRNTRGMALTAAGAQLARDLADIEQRMSAARDRADTLATGRGGRLRLGLDANAFLDLTATIVAAFAGEHPDVEMDFAAMDSGAQRDALQTGAIDVAIMLGGFGGPGLLSRVLSRLPVRVLWPQGWAVPAAGPLSWSDLAGRPRIAGAEAVSASFERILKVAADPFGGLDAPRHRVGHPAGALPLVASGVGFALCCGSPHRMPAGILDLALRDAPSPLLLSVAWRRGDSDGPATRFVRAAIERVAAPQAEAGGRLEISH